LRTQPHCPRAGCSRGQRCGGGQAPAHRPTQSLSPHAQAWHRSGRVRPSGRLRIMRHSLSTLPVALILLAAPAAAGPLHGQQRPSRQPVPAEVLEDVDAVFNSPLTRRAIGPVTVGEGQVVVTDLAVLDGPLVIRGTVTGSVLAVNAPVRMEEGSVIQGSLLIVGGELEQLGDSRVEGRVRVHPVRVNVRWDGSRLSVLGAPTDTTAVPDLVPDWWERLRNRDTGGSGFTLTSGGTYNRVEGLPILAGPRLRR